MSKITSTVLVWEFDGSYARKFRVNYEDKAGTDTRIFLEELEEDTKGYEVNKMIELDRKDLEELQAVINLILNTDKIK